MAFETTGSSAQIGPKIVLLRTFWEIAGRRFAAYAPVLPGDPSFVCQPDTCDAHCCRSFTVALGEAEIVPLVEAAGRPIAVVLESEDGVPIRLPLAQPYVLARQGGSCTLLGADRRCTAYGGRPSACQLYPHHVLFFAPDGRPVQPDIASGEAGAAVDRLIAGDDAGIRAVLVRHRECPGATGAALTDGEWAALATATWALQAVYQVPP